MGHQDGSNLTSSGQDLRTPLGSGSSRADARTQTGLASAEARAIELMDDLFQDLEYYLEDRPSASPRVSSHPPTPTATLATHSSAGLPQRGQTDELWVPYASLELDDLDLEDPWQRHPFLRSRSNPPTEGAVGDAQRFWQRLWFCLACVSLVGGGIVWVLSQVKLNPHPASPVATGSQPAPSVNPAHADFAGELSRSLQRTEAQEQAAADTAATDDTANTPRVPPIQVADPQSASPNRKAERIYVPVYQPPSPEVTPATPTKAKSATPAKAKSATPTKPSASAPTPTSPSPAAAVVPSDPVAVLTPAPPPPQSAAPPPAPPPTPKYRLDGFFIDTVTGQPTAALSSVDGPQTLKHVKEGEALDSGWVIAAIHPNLQMITVKYQGRLQDIHIDQKF